MVVKPQSSVVDSLRGILKDHPSDMDMDSLREERLLKYENSKYYQYTEKEKNNFFSVEGEPL